MPTRLRVELAGYHHVINRGVNRCDIFNRHDDKEVTPQGLNIHFYCVITLLNEK